MKVKHLIGALKQMPQDADIAFRDHDQDINEINGMVRNAEVIHFDDLENNYMNLGTMVVLSN